MSTEINNGKLHTNNIYIVKLIFLFIAFIFVSVSDSAQAINNDKSWVIVIDAGHGGRDPGALGSASREKDIALAIALKTGEYIEQNIKNVKVIYTRDKDVTLDLAERPKIANRNNADLFISIHANKTNSKSVQGTETYVMGLSKDKENLEVAMKENEVILLEDDYSTKYEGFDPKSPESYIMFSLMQNVFLKQSNDIASKVQIQFSEQLKRKDRGVKQAGFWVLFTTTMPSILIETGFISNISEEKYLNSKPGQNYLASAIFRACRDYINEIDSKSSKFPIQNQNPESETDISTAVISTRGEIVFMIQIATSASKAEVKPENFKGLKDVVEINTLDRFKYVTGSFTDYSEAARYRKKIEIVYPDAFIIAVQDNKILPLQQALEQKNKK
ncbi:MAG: N-acetylmuramoyl-L-alanine amidase [Bacteroidia bacterium]|nr:N-acetylmuramoyl-L-alanine amidase [Bacteroidia bacterium]